MLCGAMPEEWRAVKRDVQRETVRERSLAATCELCQRSQSQSWSPSLS